MAVVAALVAALVFRSRISILCPCPLICPLGPLRLLLLRPAAAPWAAIMAARQEPEATEELEPAEEPAPTVLEVQAVQGIAGQLQVPPEEISCSN